MLLMVGMVASSALAGENWPDYRGPGGDGHADAADLPLQVGRNQNVLWKTPIHGRGWSSPVVWGEQVWLTTATEDGHEMFAICVDRQSGHILHDIKLWEIENPQFINDLNSYASPSPVIEEGRVYLHFGTYGTVCLDTTTTTPRWTRRDINCDHIVGPGSSPVLYEDLLIFPVDGGDVQYVLALDKHSGKEAWKTTRSVDYRNLMPDFRKAFNTPLLVEADGRTQLISAGAEAAMAYDPESGKELWRVRFNGFSSSSRPVAGGGMVLVPTGYGRLEILAVRTDGRRDVTDTHVAWSRFRNVPSTPSPLVIDDLIYMVSDGGIATCLNLADGTELWKKRIGAEYSASLLHADGRIYYFSREGKITVLQPGRKFKALSVSHLGDGFMASPAVAGRSLFLRSKSHLYRIEKPAQQAQRGAIRRAKSNG